MGEFTLDILGNDSYLVYHVGADEQIDNAEKGMLQSNDIDGVIKPTFSQRNNERFIRYPVTSALTIRDFFSREVKKADVLRVFRSLIENIQNADEYMLKEERFFLDAEKVYVNVKTRKTSLVYIPVRQFSGEKGIRELLLSLLISCRYNTGEDLSYVARLINAINRDSASDLKQLSREISEIGSSEEKPASAPSFARTPVPPVQPDPVKKPEPASAAESIPIRKEAELNRLPEIVLEKTADNDRLQPEEEKKLSYFQRRELEKKEKKEKKEAEKREKREKKEAEKREKKEKKGGLFGWKSQKSRTEPDDLDVPGMDIPGLDDIRDDPVQDKPAEFRAMPESKPETTAGIAKAWAVQPQQVPPARAPEAGRAEPERMKAVGENGGPVQEGHSVYLGTGAAGASRENSTVIMGGGKDYSATVKMGGSSGTQAPRFVMAQLIRKKDGKTMMIQKGDEPFIIGSAADFVDFYVGDNPVIGAAHAQIRKDGSTYYIRDNNSVNHTYVNGQMVDAGENRPLNSGDTIRLGDEEFEFR